MTNKYRINHLCKQFHDYWFDRSITLANEWGPKTATPENTEAFAELMKKQMDLMRDHRRECLRCLHSA